MLATDVREIVIYLDNVIAALRDRDIAVETGFVGANRQAGRSITILLGHGPSSLSYATLSWQPVIGWSLTSRQARPRHWILPLGVLAEPDDIARAIRELTVSIRMPARG
jgi:hypothetical protein